MCAPRGRALGTHGAKVLLGDPDRHMQDAVTFVNRRLFRQLLHKLVVGMG